MVHVLGTGFQAGSQVFIGGVAATVTGQTPTTLTATVPPLPAGNPLDVKVVNPDSQQAVQVGAFTPLATPNGPPPLAFFVSPNAGSSSGGGVIHPTANRWCCLAPSSPWAGARPR